MEGVDPASDSVARFQAKDTKTGAPQIRCRGKTGRTGSDHDQVELHSLSNRTLESVVNFR